MDAIGALNGPEIGDDASIGATSFSASVVSATSQSFAEPQPLPCHALIPGGGGGGGAAAAAAASPVSGAPDLEKISADDAIEDGGDWYGGENDEDEEFELGCVDDGAEASDATELSTDHSEDSDSFGGHAAYENKEQLDFLRERDCDEGQGFYLCPPMAPEALEDWLTRTRESWPAAVGHGER